MIFYYTKNGPRVRVAFYSETPQAISQKFDSINYVPTPQEMDLIKQNYDLFVDNGVLLIEKPQTVKELEAQQIKEAEIINFQQKQAELQQKLNSNTVTVEDVAKIILLIKYYA